MWVKKLFLRNQEGEIAALNQSMPENRPCKSFQKDKSYKRILGKFKNFFLIY